MTEMLEMTHVSVLLQFLWRVRWKLRNLKIKSKQSLSLEGKFFAPKAPGAQDFLANKEVSEAHAIWRWTIE